MPQEDKRIRRTKKLLEESLLTLMRQKKFQTITIKDLVIEADMNRGTFYRHYSDTYDLLNSISESTLENYTAIINKFDTKNINSLSLVVNELYDFFRNNHAKFYCLISIPNPSNFEEHMVNKLYDTSKKFLININGDIHSSVNHCYMSFIVSGIIGVLKNSLSNNSHFTKNDISHVMTIMLDNATKTLEKNNTLYNK